MHSNIQCLKTVFPFLHFPTALVFCWQNTWHLKSFQKHYSISHIFVQHHVGKNRTMAKLPNKTTSKIQFGLITSKSKSLQQLQNMGTCTRAVWTDLNVPQSLDNFKSTQQRFANTQVSFFVFSTHITLTFIMFRLRITAAFESLTNTTTAI